MTRCPSCHRDVIQGVRLDGTAVLLDPSAAYQPWVGLNDAHLFPEDGDTVVASNALIAHGPVCPGTREGQRKARAQGQAAKAQRHQAHVGGTV